MTATLSLGVIGHVDHGKSALMRALTGVETDRLKEERERGMSIVLGFTYLETPHGVIDLIDVPGHEDFIRAMIAGSTGLDGVVLVVAANEGVMPQTREHFDIAQLLGLDRGIIVVNKADLVCADRLQTVIEELRELVRGSFLEGAPIVTASALHGQGIGELCAALAGLAGAAPQRAEGRGFYLPLDRVFTLRGFGVVGTGTLRRGRLRVSDRVQIMPGGRTATVRALESRNRPIEEALPGQRVAVNLRKVGREQLARGDTIATPGLLAVTRQVDAQLRLQGSALPSAQKGISNGATVRLLIGTTEAIAKVRLLDRAGLAPGEMGLVQLRCDRDIATSEGERFVIRSYSPMTTIGGGRILDASPERHRRFDAAVTRRLESLAAGDAVATLGQLVAESALVGVETSAAAERLGLTSEALLATAAEARVLSIDDRLVGQADFAQLLEAIERAVASHHHDHPQQRGVAAGRVSSALSPQPHEAVFRHALADLVASGRLRSDGQVLALVGFDPLANLSARERAAAVALEKTFRDCGVEAPSPAQVVGREKDKSAALRSLVETGRLVRLRTYDRGTMLVLHVDTLEEVKGRLRERYPYPARFALKDVRDLLETTRRFVLPLLEHFDTTGITIRHGDLRQLREQIGGE